MILPILMSGPLFSMEWNGLSPVKYTFSASRAACFWIQISFIMPEYATSANCPSETSLLKQMPEEKLLQEVSSSLPGLHPGFRRSPLAAFQKLGSEALESPAPTPGKFPISEGLGYAIFKVNSWGFSTPTLGPVTPVWASRLILKIYGCLAWFSVREITAGLKKPGENWLGNPWEMISPWKHL